MRWTRKVKTGKPILEKLLFSLLKNQNKGEKIIGGNDKLVGCSRVEKVKQN